MADFKQDLLFSQGQEKKLIERFGNLQANRVDRAGDLLLISTGERVEVKNDRYDPRSFKNFIFEKHRSNVNDKGGPWQAEEHNCKYFLYHYTETNQVYLFDTIQLCRFLEGIEDFLPMHYFNKTGFYKVDRSLVKHLFLKLEILNG